MDKKSFILIGGCLLAGTVEAKQVRPNVIIIYTDDQGTLDANCFGAKDLYTPNIDSLAIHGIRFTQFYAAPVSSASRASLLTGQYTKRAGLTGNAGWKGLPLEKETIAERMRKNGYQTACIGKWHLGSWKEYAPNARGFDYFWGFRGGCIDSYSHFYYWGGPNKHDLWRNEQEIYEPGKFFTDETLKEVKGFIKDRDKERPFFLYWAVNIPHYPLQPSEKWLDYYSKLPNPRRMYAAFVSTFDEYLGELRTFLTSQGLDENTIVIFQSDNGHSTEVRTFGGGGYCGDYRGGKFSLFEGGIRVPAIVSWIGHLPEGEVRNQIAMNVDWFPTIAELCNISTGGLELDGKSLVPLIEDGTLESPHDVLHFDFEKQWAVRYGDWKLISNAIDVLPNDKNKVLEGLYLANLKENPSESENLKDKYPEKVKELLILRKQYEESLPIEMKK